MLFCSWCLFNSAHKVNTLLFTTVVRQMHYCAKILSFYTIAMKANVALKWGKING